MSHFKQFSYPDISKRWMLLLSVFLTFFIIVTIVSDVILRFNQYFPYSNDQRYILLIALLAFFAGNIIGKISYKLIKRYKAINIAAASLLLLFLFFYFFKETIWGEDFSLLNIYIRFQFIVSLALSIPFFLAGFINCYYTKIVTGDFIDEKNLLSKYLVMLFLAVSSGSLVLLTKYIFYPDFIYINYIYMLMALGILICLIYVNIPFMPENLIAQHYTDDEHIEQDNTRIYREDLFYTYLNFSYITIYFCLGLVAFNKFFGSIYYYNFIYIAVVLLGVIIGSTIGKIKRFSSWHIYSEMLYPISFLLYLFFLYGYEDKIPFAAGLLFLAIPFLVFGFSIRQTIFNIINNFDHDKRFNIINFSLFVLPIPLIIASTLVNYTNLYFFIILYLITILNIVVPGLYLFNSSLSFGKKIFYFFFSLLFIPAIIFMHFYFSISINNKLFIDDIVNFELLRNTNYNLPYINERGDIKKYNSTIFNLSESSIRNMKRAAAATSLFCGENAKTLIIDSNQKFFKNPLFGFFTNAVVIDNVPPEYIRYNKLPISGRQLYITEEKNILTYIIGKGDQYHSIIDVPNILDQNFHPFRFSKDYHALIKKHLSADGIYVNIINLQFANYDLISDSLMALSEIYKHHYVFIFSNIVMTISSDSINSLKINKDSIARINKIINNTLIYGLIFYNDTQPLNYITFNNLKSFKELLETQNKINPYIYREIEPKRLTEQLAGHYFSPNDKLVDSLFADDNENRATTNSVKYSLARNAAILELLKKAEYAESIDEYEQVTNLLFQLKKYSPYNSELKKYIELILEHKKNYYYNEALRLEKLNRWDEAIIIYKAMLIIDSGNFDVNYKLGLLYLTIQDLNNSFKYLDIALKLNRNHPQALYQMGILLFSSDKFKESIEYLSKAKELGINTSTLYLYLGISYERINNTEKARENLEKAIMLDPTDVKLKFMMEQLNQRIAIEFNPWNNDDKTNMDEDEQGEEIRIPINKRAINSRLKDSEKNE